MSLRRAIRLGLGGTVMLALGVGVLGYYAVQHRRTASAPAAEGVTVTVGAQRCDPDRLAVEAGWNSFTIRNNSARVMEWEILDGVMVVEERENIAPGMTQRLRAKLAPGRYSITCGLLSNPRGELVVRPAAGGGDAPRGADPVALIGPRAEYKVSLILGSDDLVEAAGALRDAAVAGDAAAATAALREARTAYGRMAPVLRVVFSDLDARIDGRAALYPAGASDPGFTGLRHLALLLGGEADGAALRPLADALVADAAALQARLEGITVPPERMVSASQRWLRDMSDRLAPDAPPGVERPDPVELAAGLEGVGKVEALLRPLAPATRPADTAPASPAGATGPDEAAQGLVTRAAALQALGAALGFEENAP
ncbi:cupredoxin domain-containing protein [Roseomonas elaeocarpi]|uniref:Cupredoxin domain-containing protein n=1 Tax=Roseomonas elaeocarpi TaxID=907779 RepID=A0ABV6JME7_9PROT